MLNDSELNCSLSGNPPFKYSLHVHRRWITHNGQARDVADLCACFAVRSGSSLCNRAGPPGMGSCLGDAMPESNPMWKKCAVVVRSNTGPTGQSLLTFSSFGYNHALWRCGCCRQQVRPQETNRGLDQRILHLMVLAVIAPTLYSFVLLGWQSFLRHTSSRSTDRRLLLVHGPKSKPPFWPLPAAICEPGQLYWVAI